MSTEPSEVSVSILVLDSDPSSSEISALLEISIDSDSTDSSDHIQATQTMTEPVTKPLQQRLGDIVRYDNEVEPSLKSAICKFYDAYGDLKTHYPCRDGDHCKNIHPGDDQWHRLLREGKIPKRAHQRCETFDDKGNPVLGKKCIGGTFACLNYHPWQSGWRELGKTRTKIADGMCKCTAFYSEGRAVGAGCQQRSTCRFVHPDDHAWKEAITLVPPLSYTFFWKDPSSSSRLPKKTDRSNDRPSPYRPRQIHRRDDQVYTDNTYIPRAPRGRDRSSSPPSSIPSRARVGFQHGRSAATTSFRSSTRGSPAAVRSDTPPSTRPSVPSTSRARNSHTFETPRGRAGSASRHPVERDPYPTSPPRQPLSTTRNWQNTDSTLYFTQAQDSSSPCTFPAQQNPNSGHLAKKTPIQIPAAKREGRYLVKDLETLATSLFRDTGLSNLPSIINSIVTQQADKIQCLEEKIKTLEGRFNSGHTPSPETKKRKRSWEELLRRQSLEDRSESFSRGLENLEASSERHSGKIRNLQDKTDKIGGVKQELAGSVLEDSKARLTPLIEAVLEQRLERLMSHVQGRLPNVNHLTRLGSGPLSPPLTPSFTVSSGIDLSTVQSAAAFLAKVRSHKTAIPYGASE